MNGQTNRRKLNNPRVFINLFLVLLSGAVILLTLNLTMEVLEERDKETTATFVGNIVDSAVENAVSVPIRLARSMASNTFLRNYVQDNEDAASQEFEDTICAYLTEVKESENCSRAYFSDARTLRYYSDKGFQKVLDFSEGNYDNWYLDFVNSKQEYSIDIEYDIMNANVWTVFVDYRMEDANGNLVGVCTVGVQMDFLREMIQTMCADYGISILMTDSEGVVQMIDGESQDYRAGDQIESELLKDGHSTVVDGGYLSVCGISYMNWYLLILNSHNIYTQAISRYVYFLFGIAIVLIYSILLYASLSVSTLTKKVKNESLIDGVTGLLNRKGYDESIKPYEAEQNWTRFQFEIEGLDGSKMDMQTYQEELQRIAGVLKRTFQGGDIIARTAPKTFCVFCRSDLTDSAIQEKTNRVSNEVDIESRVLETCTIHVRTNMQRGKA